MNFSIMLDTVMSGWPIKYIEEPQVINLPKVYCISFSKDEFCLAHSADPGEILHSAAFHPVLFLNESTCCWCSKEPSR